MKNRYKNKNNTLFFYLALPLSLAVFFIITGHCKAASSIIINEIQTAGATANDEWIELYNPTDGDIDISQWSIQYRGGNGAAYSKKNFESGMVVPGKGFFLIAHGGEGNYDGTVVFDMSWSQPLSATGGTIFLVDNQTLLTDGSSSFIVDKVAYGAGAYLVPENIQAIKPESNQGIERKNFQDTDDNSADFYLLDMPNPQNSVGEDDSDEGTEEDLIPICTGGIILSEIFPFAGEFVEVENTGGEKCDLVGWKVGDEVNSPHAFPVDSIIEPGGYFAFARDFDLNSASSDSARLFNPTDSEPIEIRAYEKPESDHSYSRDDLDEWKWTDIITSGKKNEFEVKKEYPDGISITELFPDPDKSGYEEYVELYNSTDEDIDLLDWKLHDASLSGEYTFEESTIIEAEEYLAIFKKDFGFALNNDDESVTLYDPNGKQISKVSYTDGKKDASYNFKEKDEWHWSKFLTPGEENVFEKVPVGELNIDEDIYVNVYANFEIGGLSKEAKVTWDFGDDHHSYLQVTRHKYEKTGKYSASVKYSEGSEDVVKKFAVDVGKVPHPEVKIISINANPVGSDTDFESLTILNKSKKKINLNGWSIATGWKTLSNHPITQDFEIKAGKEKEITREFSKFTLNNKKSKIELRYPDGEVAYDVKYKSEKGINEGEIYVKGKNGWKWEKTSKDTRDKIQISKSNNQTEGINQEDLTNNQVAEDQIGMQSRIERLNQLALNRNNIVEIELLSTMPRVLGAETIREIDGIYYFNPEYPRQEHYAVIFLKNIFVLLNMKTNMLINYFFS